MSDMQNLTLQRVHDLVDVTVGLPPTELNRLFGTAFALIEVLTVVLDDALQRIEQLERIAKLL